MLWSAEGLGDGYSTVSIANGKIYTTGMVDDQGILTCLNVDGETLWKADYGPEWKRSFPGTRCTPTIHQGRVYVISGTGQVACFDSSTGDKIWMKDIFGEFEGQYPRWGYSESPLIVEGKVIFTVGGTKALIVALDAHDGSVAWITPSNGDKSTFCSPIALNWAGKIIVVNMTSDHVLGIDEKTGSILFSIPVSNYVTGKIRSNHPNTPIVYDGKIFVSSGYNMGSAQFKLLKDGSSVEKVWQNSDLDNHHGGIVLIDGFLYGANWHSNNEGNWVCVDWETGKTAYEQPWHNKGSLTYADGMLYCYEEKEGHVALVKASPEGFCPVSSFAVPLGQKEHWAHPVVCGKRLYIRHGDVLMAFDIAG
jgi:outer membrane protein assembly factor BamB